MSEKEPSAETRFDQDEAGLACGYCQAEIYDAYFEIDGKTSCQKCRYTVEDRRVNGSGAGRFLRAGLAGSVAAMVGAGIYYAVLAITDYEFALVSILVGLMVGFAVSWGSGYRGGWVYQSLAVGLTYLAIVSTYVPFVFEAWEEEAALEASLSEKSDPTPPSAQATPAATWEEPTQLSAGEFVVSFAAFVVLVAAIPFLAGAKNLLGLLIIGFGLFEAWRLNQFQPLNIEGPFRRDHLRTSEE